MHGALEDAELCADVLEGQIRLHSDLATLSLEELATYSQPDGMCDFSGKLYRDGNGEVCYAFGTDKGKVVRLNPGLAKWALARDFPADTKAWLRGLMDGTRK
jgi:DNA polymerase III epsilon subunit-like protein